MRATRRKTPASFAIASIAIAALLLMSGCRRRASIAIPLHVHAPLAREGAWRDAPSTEASPVLRNGTRRATMTKAPPMLFDDVLLEGTVDTSARSLCCGPSDRDEDTCAPALHLASPVHVRRHDGRETTAGGAKHVCLWHWEGADEALPPPVQDGSRVIVRGRPTPRVRTNQPNAILLYETRIASAAPPDTSAPARAFPEGQSFVYLRAVDPAARTVALDLAHLYYGDDAALAGPAHGTTGAPERGWHVVNDSTQLRTVTLPRDVTAQTPTPRPDEGASADGAHARVAWAGIPMADLAQGLMGRAFFLTVKNGQVTAFDEAVLPSRMVPPDAPRPDACIVVDASGVMGHPFEAEGLVQAIRAPDITGPVEASFDAIVLRLDKPRCYRGSTAPVTEIQLTPPDQGMRALWPLVGTRVHLTGEAMGRHSPWHARDVLMSVFDIKRR